MRKYFCVYLQFIKFMIQYILQYRLNAVALSIYFPTWQLLGLGIIWLMYEQTPLVGGWTRPEIFTLYFVINIMFCVTFFLFIDGGVRHMMWNSVRTGEFDFALTKPLNIQFMSIFARPSIAPVLSMLVLVPIFIFYVWQSQLVTNWIPVVLFLVVNIISTLILYFVISAYATLAFYSTQSYQVVETLVKSTEFAHYPLTIFPLPLQLILSTILPVIFFGYAATLFLLGKGTLTFFIVLIIALGISVVINKFAWREGLKRYTSASS